MLTVSEKYKTRISMHFQSASQSVKEDILLDALQIVENVGKEQQRSVSRVFVIPLLHSPDVCKVLKGSCASSCCMRRKVVEQVLQPIALRWSSLSTTNPF